MTFEPFDDFTKNWRSIDVRAMVIRPWNRTETGVLPQLLMDELTMLKGNAAIFRAMPQENRLLKLARKAQRIGALIVFLLQRSKPGL